MPISSAISAVLSNLTTCSKIVTVISYHVTTKFSRQKLIFLDEHSRVKLNSVEGLLGSDFVSANWISGETPGTDRAYIASQGPLQHTVEDFWRMVKEQNVKVIVMLSNLLENGRVFL
jgi:protein tyrosine phosphatase